jgi:hypothetical protein
MSWTDRIAALGAIFAAVVALLTILQLMTSGVEYLIVLRRRFRAWRHRPRYILIIPTNEEVAKYSVRLPDRHEPEVRDIREDYALEERLHREQIQRLRVMLMLLAFSLLYLLLFVRLLYIGLSEPH